MNPTVRQRNRRNRRLARKRRTDPKQVSARKRKMVRKRRRAGR